MSRFGFIGLGAMGTAMAGRLVDAAFDTVVWNRSKGKADGLVARGAVEVESVVEVFRECDVILSILSNDAAVDETFSDDVLKHGEGKLHVNMATVSLEQSRVLADRHAEHGVRYIAAPVLGRPEVAASGQLNIVAAGAAEDIDRAQGAFDQIGKQTWRVGETPDKAALVKIGVNYNIIHALQALGESVSLMEHGGIDGQTFVDILTDAAFTGAVYEGYGNIIAQQAYFPSAFGLGLGLKDLGLAQGAAEEVGASLPTASVMKDMFDEALADSELRDGSWAIIAEVIRRGPQA